MENQKIIIHKDGDGPVIVHHLTGNLPEPINEKGSKFTGNIFAVKDYIDKKAAYEPDMKKTAVILFNRNENQIKLLTMPGHPLSDEVTAELEISQKIIEFGINELDKRFRPEELKRLLKLNPHVFASKESHLAFLKQIGNFKAKIENDIEESKDTKGNSVSKRDTKVFNLDVTENFTMKCPIFKGGEIASFEVQVGYEVAGQGILFLMESPELIVLFDETISKEFEDQRTIFAGKEYVTIMQ